MINTLIPKKLYDHTYRFLTPLADRLVERKIKASQLTWTGLVLAVLAGLCAMKGKFFFGSLLAGLAGIMDMLDGMVARQSQTASPVGVVLDSSVDRYSDFFLLAGLIIKYKDFFVNFYLGFASLIGTFMVSYAQAKGEALQVETPTGFMKRPDRWLILSVAMLLSSVRPLGHLPIFFALLFLSIGTNYCAIKRLKQIAQAAALKN